jgi:cation transport ATPase
LTTPPSVTSRSGELTVTDEAVFAPGQERRMRLFVRRIMGVPDVSALKINPAGATAILNYRRPSSGAAELLRRLADATAGGEPLAEAELPPWRPDEPVVLCRYCDIVSTLDVQSLVRGCLRASHPAIKYEPATAQRIESALRAASGVLAVTLSAATAMLDVRFDPALTEGRVLLRLVETALTVRPDVPAMSSAEYPGFTVANISLGVSAVGEFVAPIVLPVAAALLLLGNVSTLRTGAGQLREGKLGLPVLYSSIVLCTLLSGSFVSAALMFWFFRYWEWRHRGDLAEENTGLLSEMVDLPERAHLVTADGTNVVPAAEIEAGQLVRVLVGETIPVDGTVMAGAAVIEEGMLGGSGQRGLRARGDEVLAGSTVLAGRIDLAMRRSGWCTHTAQIAHVIRATTTPSSAAWSLTPEAETFAARAVPPTLVAAAVGLVVGGPLTANAVLRPDYATGIGLTAPLRMVLTSQMASRQGALVRSPDALAHIAAGVWVVLDDYDGLDEPDCELAEYRLRGIEADQLLPAVAAAGAWLGDARGPALARACAARGLIARHAQLRHIDEAALVVDYGQHVVCLRGLAARASTPPLRVEVDGIEVAGLRFHRNGLVPSATTVRRLRRAGLRVFLASSRTPAATAIVARRIGVDDYAGGLDDTAKCNLLQALHERGVTVLHVRDGPALPHVRSDYVSIALAPPHGIQPDGDIAVFSRSIIGLPALIALARAHVARNRRDRSTVVAFNLMAVVGVFAFGFTGLTVVLISNLATHLVRDSARRALAEARTKASGNGDIAAAFLDTGDEVHELAPDGTSEGRPSTAGLLRSFSTPTMTA